VLEKSQTYPALSKMLSLALIAKGDECDDLIMHLNELAAENKSLKRTINELSVIVDDSLTPSEIKTSNHTARV